MDTNLLRAYRSVRAKGYRARDAMIHARTTLAFQALESEGHARLRFEPDPEPVNCDHADDRMAKLADEKGVWGLIAERKCPCCERVDGGRIGVGPHRARRRGL